MNLEMMALLRGFQKFLKGSPEGVTKDFLMGSPEGVSKDSTEGFSFGGLSKDLQ